MKLAIAIAALLAAAPASSHSWYTGTQNSVGWGCCGGGDCQQIPDSRRVRRNADGTYDVELYFGDVPNMRDGSGDYCYGDSECIGYEGMNGKPAWFRIMGAPMFSPDGHMHACMMLGDFMDRRVRCFFMGGTM